MTTQLLQLLYEHRERLPQFTVYDHPTDFPEDYVARLWLSLPVPRPTSIILRHPELEVLRDELSGLNLFRVPRQEGDDPKIVETWI